MSVDASWTGPDEAAERGVKVLFSWNSPSSEASRTPWLERCCHQHQSLNDFDLSSTYPKYHNFWTCPARTPPESSTSRCFVLLDQSNGTVLPSISVYESLSCGLGVPEVSVALELSRQRCKSTSREPSPEISRQGVKCPWPTGTIDGHDAARDQYLM
jgi:hypothetical protein